MGVVNGVVVVVVSFTMLCCGILSWVKLEASIFCFVFQECGEDQSMSSMMFADDETQGSFGVISIGIGCI